MVVMFADSLGKSGNPVAERNKFLAFTITSSVVLLAALTFFLTSVLGVYSGVIALKGASGAIFSLVRSLTE
jgi:membrane associated rhomboid family serine protease